MCWESDKPAKPSEPEEGTPGDDTTTEPGSTTPEPDDPIDCTLQQFGPEEVVQYITETISDAPYPYTAWNDDFDWYSKFTLYVSRDNCSITVTVRIKVDGTITDQQLLDWETAIESKWNNKVTMNCVDTTCPAACPSGYAVLIDLEFVDAGEHYVVTAQQTGATGGGITGGNGTTSMTAWGVTDLVDITHEFGHMLGNTEEYFTVNGVPYGTFRDPNGAIMNNPANDPLPRNYYLIEQQAAALMGSAVTCVTY